VTFDPANRLSVLEALKHPYLEAYHDEDDEPECETKYDHWKEIEKLETVDQYRTSIWNEVEEFRREVREMVVEAETPEPTTENGVEVTSEGAEKPTVGPTVTVESPGGPKPILEGDITEEPAKSPSDLEAVPAGPVPFPSSGHNSPLPAASTVPLPRQEPGSRTKSSVDPYEIYARRSIILPPSPQAINGSLPPGGIDPKDPTPIDQQLSASYIVPARSRAASAADGTIGPGGFTGTFPRLLRTLSTLSVNDSVAGAARAALGRIQDDKTSISAADAPPSSIPLEFRPKKREG
jgi:serine/threonine protein kinase